MGFGIFAHALDFSVIQAGGGGNGDVLAAAGGFVQGSNFQNAVGVDIESDLNLWDATRGRWDAVQDELAQRIVVRC